MSRDIKKAVTPWLPRIPSTGAPWANRVAEAIAVDVASGRLAPGDQLPTQRALARHLGITVGTVNRGYAIAERAGVVTAEVGRGTFVALSDNATAQSTNLVSRTSSTIDLALNYPAGSEAEPALSKLLPHLAKWKSAGLLGLSPYEGQPRHRAAGARWLQHLGLSVGEEELLLCSSVQHGLAAILAALTVPGDVVLTESLTSPGIKALAAMHHLRLVAVEGDAKGLLPEALTEACRSKARLLYTMPTLHTPTAITMPDERRRSIAEVLRQHSLVAIEDDAWGFLAAGAVAPLHAFARENVVYVTSVSKSLAPGLRVGYIVAPKPLQRGITSCIGTMTWTSPLLAEVVTQWIEDGTAASIAEQRIQTAGKRLQLAGKVLGRSFTRPRPPAYHIWLPLSEPWRVDDFVNHAATLGVSLAPTDMFVPGRAPTPHAVRVCLGTEPDIGRLEEGLSIIARMLKSGPAGYSAFRV